jgi:diguanylate cyclase (GGDEF)-like protein
MDAGADDYIRKPFHPAELKARLRSGKRIVDLEEKLRRQATHDALTHILNRGAIMERIAIEMERSYRKNENLCIAMVDLDHFKEVNDTFGHSAGDTVLCETASRMSSVLRPYDSIGRYGGEEFIVVFPRCDVSAAAAIAERIRRAISIAPVGAQNDRISVTASIGIAEARNSKDADAVIREADWLSFAPSRRDGTESSSQFSNVCQEAWQTEIRASCETLQQTALSRSSAIHFQRRQLPIPISRTTLLLHGILTPGPSSRVPARQPTPDPPREPEAIPSMCARL